MTHFLFEGKTETIQSVLFQSTVLYLGQILAARLVARKLVRPGLIAGDRVGDQKQLVALDLLGEFHRIKIRREYATQIKWA